jgi:DNA-binding transcriptional regulator YiaG
MSKAPNYIAKLIFSGCFDTICYMTSLEFYHLRQAMGITQQQLADLMAVHRTRIADWERAARPIPPYIAKLIECLFHRHFESQ